MISFAGILMMLLAGGPTDLLDVVHTDAYWKAKQVTVSAEQLIADASGKGAAAAGDPSAPQAAAVRRLMAIRTLGETKQAGAVSTLQGLTEAKEPFVADYAKAAIAAIQGKPIARPVPPADARMTDVWMLPAQSDLVAQVTTTGMPPVAGDIFGDMPLPAGANKQEILAQMTGSLLPVVERIGNVHLASITLGLHGAAQGGYGVIVARGQYDAKAAAAMLAQQQTPSTTVDGIEVFQPEKSVALILTSDTRAVLVVADGADALPLAAVIAAVKKGTGNLRDDAESNCLPSRGRS
jgi:hypothetical protein